jgi:hypothetical protein
VAAHKLAAISHEQQRHGRSPTGATSAKARLQRIGIVVDDLANRLSATRGPTLAETAAIRTYAGDLHREAIAIQGLLAALQRGDRPGMTRQRVAISAAGRDALVHAAQAGFAGCGQARILAAK